MLQCIREHADFMLQTGLAYPPSEVNFEQSIVAPACDLLLQVYELTHEKRYLQGAEQQLFVLEQFQVMQSDYHLYECAIRHWDGYWFGKHKCYGDTFPHYWTVLTAVCFSRYAKLIAATAAARAECYKVRAENGAHSTLSMFFPDGSASCACVYPATVNGTPAGFYDPFANDQNWALYLYGKMLAD